MNVTKEAHKIQAQIGRRLSHVRFLFNLGQFGLEQRKVFVSGLKENS